MAMSNQYVSGLFDSSGKALYLLQRLGVIGVGTQAVAASHDAMIQFCTATKRTGMYQYIILNKWLMPFAFPGAQKPMTRSKDCSLQCALFSHPRGESTVHVHYSPCFWSLFLYTWKSTRH